MLRVGDGDKLGRILVHYHWIGSRYPEGHHPPAPMTSTSEGSNSQRRIYLPLSTDLRTPGILLDRSIRDGKTIRVDALFNGRRSPDWSGRTCVHNYDGPLGKEEGNLGNQEDLMGACPRGEYQMSRDVRISRIG